ncbi:hypothetical protein ARMGADRAFT_927244 [Armillaria gallica]|uniref:Uncharacterized protein n=1 Tax=Armillaria gallica TaxID=47427 RepID=A0A2H3DU22_ARMGA|nr:hypothetical protein ARMGADRAFT_927244 [Armillaria gallica]
MLGPNTIDDWSPLITYSPAGYWAQGNSAKDPELTKYWGNSYTYTWNPGASASFTFNGTGITILGTRRSTHGSYTVILDGKPKVLDATASDPIEYQANLFNVTGLQQKEHTVTVTNADASVYLDCLHVCQQIHWWGEADSGELQELSHEMDDDTDSKFFWYPADAWKNPPSNISQFSNGTGQFVAFPLCMLSDLSSCSDAVSVFGTSGPQNGNYTARLDDIFSGAFSAKRDTYETGVMLFQADNLGGGAHTLSLVNGDEGELLEIDYALSYIDPSRTPPESS